jgi:hypothetical protein
LRHTVHAIRDVESRLERIRAEARERDKHGHEVGTEYDLRVFRQILSDAEAGLRALRKWEERVLG